MTRSHPSRRHDGPPAFHGDQRRSDLAVVRTSDADRIEQLQDELAELERAYEALEVAVATARRIGAAIGIVTTVMKVTEADAFAMLVRISQRQNRKLRLVADDIVLTGAF